MKINMSIVFHQIADFTTICCPRCETSYTAEENTLIQWYVFFLKAIHAPDLQLRTDEKVAQIKTVGCGSE
jgi:hypothetical protein